MKFLNCFPLALDLSTISKEKIQVAVFIGGITSDLQVLQLVPLSGTNRQDIFKAILQCVEHHSLELSRRCPGGNWGEDGRLFPLRADFTVLWLAP